MSEIRIANRYAKSLLDLSIEKKGLEAVYEDINCFNEICDSNRDFVLLLKNPIISHLKKKTILEKLFKTKFNQLTMAFLTLATQKGRAFYLPQIGRQFYVLYKEKQNVKLANVTTAVPIDKKLRQQVVDFIEKRTNKKVELTETVDASIIGGLIVQFDGFQLNDSIAGQLADLKLKFSNQTNIK